VKQAPGCTIGSELEIDNLPRGAACRAITLDRAKRFGEAAIEVRGTSHIAAVKGDDASAARDKIDEALESGFDGIEVLVDIGVIELD
jgi:hypothetical protein